MCLNDRFYDVLIFKRVIMSISKLQYFKNVTIPITNHRRDFKENGHEVLLNNNNANIC